MRTRPLASPVARLVAFAALAALVACSAETTGETDSITDETPSTAKQLNGAKVNADGTPATATATATGTATTTATTTAAGSEGAPIAAAGAVGFAAGSASGAASNSGAASDTGGASNSGAASDTAGPLSPERAIAQKLGKPHRMLVGLGNDAEGKDPAQMSAYGLGTTPDVHYMYLSGLDWPEWNAPTGNYVTLQANAAKTRGIVPMFTLYQAAAYGESNLGAFDTVEFMTRYWRGVRIMFEKLGAFGAPAIVHVEPDFWGYTQKKSETAAGVPMKVGAIVPECADLPSDVSGMVKCITRLSRKLAPQVVLGFQASGFGAYTNGSSDPVKIGNYLKRIGAGEADLIVIETLDRDAGCFEVGADANCKRAGTFYWDEQNVAHPNFHDHLAWAKALRETLGLPLLWWQMPLGVAASTPGYAGKYRDNRVKYFFAHPEEFAAAGGIGAVFGTGAANQTTVKTDGGQFKTALASYATKPAELR